MEVCTSALTQVLAKCICFYEYSCHLKELVSQEKPVFHLLPSSKILREMVWEHTPKPSRLRD